MLHKFKTYGFFCLFYLLILPTQTAYAEKMNDDFRGDGYPVTICDKTYTGTSANCEISGHGKALLVKGNLISQDQIYIGGMMLVASDGHISQIGCHVSGRDAVTLNCPGALISPGFINLHEHIEYSYYTPRTLPKKRWLDRNEWRAAPASVRGFEDQKPSDPFLRTVVSERAMLRHLLSGTTALVGAEQYHAFNRNLGISQKFSGSPLMYPVTNKTFPFESPVPGTLPCGHAQSGEIKFNAANAYVPHVGEGVDQLASCEIDNMLYALKNKKSPTALVHMIPVDKRQIKELKKQQLSIVISPRSNFELYGVTAPIPMLLDSGVNMALGTDWSVTGSLTMLDEMRCLAHYNHQNLNNVLTWADMHRMMTQNAAKATGLQNQLGGLLPGAIADFVIIDTKGSRALGEILKHAALPEIIAVFIEGRGATFPASWTGKLTGTLDNCSVDPRNLCGQSRVICGANSARSLVQLFDTTIYTINDAILCHPQSVDACSEN